MVKVEHLSKAPIKEAIIDLRVALPEGCTHSDLKLVADKLVDYFPTAQEQRVITHEISDGPDGSNSRKISEKLNGFRLLSEDDHYVLQISTDGFTLSELEPYTKWSDFSALAQKAWQIYAELTNCDHIKKVAVRYINQIELPLTNGTPFSKFLAVPPMTPKGLPEGVQEFASRVSFTDDERGLSARVTQSIQPKSESSGIVLLDIDAYKDSDSHLVYDTIWDVFSKLREFKNDIFFGYITDETKDLLR